MLAPNKPVLRHENVAGCADHDLSKPARTRTWVKGLGVGCLNIAAPFDPYSKLLKRGYIRDSSHDWGGY